MVPPWSSHEFMIQIQRLRRLRISLAAKCQLLFGAAVVLIIAAALFVPWHRIEQLTEQLNERAAGALAERAIAEHIADYTAAMPATAPAAAPTTLPAAAASSAAPMAPAARLVGLGGSRELTEANRF